MDNQLQELIGKGEEIKNLIRQNKLADAASVCGEYLNFTAVNYGERHPFFALGINSMAQIYEKTGNYKIAEELYGKAVDLYRETVGTRHPFYAAALSNAAGLYIATCSLEKAEELCLKAIEANRDIYGEVHRETILCKHNLAVVYRRAGLYRRAERMFKELLTIMEGRQEYDFRDYTALLENLAILYIDAGSCIDAERVLKKSIRIIAGECGEEHSCYGMSLNNLAQLYRRTGAYAEAEELCSRALKIILDNYGDEHPYYAAVLNNIAMLQSRNREYSELKHMLSKVREITGKALGAQHPDYSSCLNNLAALHMEKGRYREAEALYLEAAEICSKCLGEEHPDYAFKIRNLAEVYIAEKRFAEARILAQRALKILCRTLGKSHPETAEALFLFSRLYAAGGDMAKAFELMKRALEIHITGLRQIIHITDEQRRLQYLSDIKLYMSALLSMLNMYKTHPLKEIEQAYDILIKCKGISIDISKIKQFEVLVDAHPDLADEYKEYIMLNKQLSALVFQKQKPQGGTESSDITGVLTERISQIEEKLASKPDYKGLVDSILKAGCKDAIGALPEDTVFVEYIKYRQFDFCAAPAEGEGYWKQERYAAFILSRDKQYRIEMLDLGKAEGTDCLVNLYRTCITSSVEDDSFDTLFRRGEDLRKALIDPLRPYFGDASCLIIAPDGELSKLPFEVLPEEEKGVYLIDNYRISYVNTGRDLVSMNRKREKYGEEALVAANPDFFLKLGEIGRVTDMGTEERDSIIQRNMAECFPPMDPLPFSAVEGEKIAKLLNTTPLTGKEVLEGRIKKAEAPYVLHIATHGFFMEDQKRERASHNEPWADNPMLYSGLLLAGAGTWLEGGELPEEAEDGILTSNDIAFMDLDGTDMVVLSACNTGIGDIKTGEGVFGMRRAFKLAGANTLVMSLWNVSDIAALLLMEKFYTNMLEAGMNKRDSLREAQLYIRDMPLAVLKKKLAEMEVKPDKCFMDYIYSLSGEYKYFNHPYYWGAFICQGHTGELRGI